MYRILIVDDEPLVRRGIKRSVNWNELGIEMVAEAANGVEALSQVLENVPDIILLDINMPKMDGLEFASIVKKQYPGTKIVIITGYHDFEYARSALRLGVDDYIVKPITKEDVAKLVREQIAKIEEGRGGEPDDKPDEPKKQRETLNAILKKEQRALADVPKFCAEWAWPEDRQLSLVLMRDYLSDCEIWNEGETDELAEFAILNIAGELLEMRECGLAFETYRNEMAQLLTCPENEINGVLAELYGSLLDFLEIPVDFAVSARGTLKGLPELAEQAREALSCAFVLHDQNIIFFEDVAKKRQDRGSRYPEQLEIQLLERMFTGELEQTLKLIDEFFARLAEVTIDVKQCKNYLLRLLLKISNTIESVSIRTDGSFEGEGGSLGDFDPAKEVDRFESLEDAKIWLKDLYTDTCRYVTRVKSRTGQLFLKIRTYIEKHFGDSDLNLKKCSEELYLSPSYIGMILKKESGKTFVDYLNEYRIKKAAEFLGRPESKIYEVSTDVGFTHPTYFSSVFKKMMGVSPKQYKESNLT